MVSIHLGLFFNRTMYLYSVAPLHPPPVPLAQDEGSLTLGGHRLPDLANELQQYLNLRLADADGLREQVGVADDSAAPDRETEEPQTAVNADADGPSDGRSRTKRRRMVPPNPNAVVREVRAAWASGLGLSAPQSLPAQAWCIEVELSPPISDTPVTVQPGSLSCHLVFLPSFQGTERASVGSRALLYPLVLTSSAPATGALGRVAVEQTMGWIAAKFDTTLSAPSVMGTLLPSLLSSSNPSPSFPLSDVPTEDTRREGEGASVMGQIAEQALRLARQELRDLASHVPASDRQALLADHIDPGPLNLTYALPSVLPSGSAGGGTIPGPSPDLNTITLTIPWVVGEALLPPLLSERRQRRSAPEDKGEVPLLPAIEAYVRYHTCLPLPQTPRTGLEGKTAVASSAHLITMGIAGIHLHITGRSVRIKWVDVPSLWAAEAVRADERTEWYKSFAAKARRLRVATILERLRAALETGGSATGAGKV